MGPALEEAPGGAAPWVSLHRSPFLLLQVLALLRAPGLAGAGVLGEGLRATGYSESDLGLATVS